jgi:FkbM family methyltransferase
MKRMHAMVEVMARLSMLPGMLFGTKNDHLYRALLAKRLEPVWTQAIEVGVGSMSFAAPSPQALYRAWTSLTKEPDTIAWIDGFSPNSVFFDVGANIGVFSVYAAASGHRVYAFDPVAENHATLQKNIEINGFGSIAACYCVAIDARNGVGSLYVDQTNAGGTSQFDVRTEATQSQRSSICRTLDSLVFDDGMPFPAHIKIDVDGNEDKVLAGADRTLVDQRLRSVHIEINGSNVDKTLFREKMEDYGFKAKSAIRNNVTFTR